MCLAKIVFAVFAWTTMTNHVLVSSQEKDELPEEKTEPPPVENHRFMALIDIVFADGSKRQCTGTIIHDNVVVTAAHCFLKHVPQYADVELSSSFVVIGSKKMFDMGYENYLPIERIVTHPRYKGWTADIALVFTFAGMVTEKPGYAIPLVQESASTPVDSNVTILSWGRCADDAEKQPPVPKSGEKKRRCTSSEEENWKITLIYKVYQKGVVKFKGVVQTMKLNIFLHGIIVMAKKYSTVPYIYVKNLANRQVPTSRSGRVLVLRNENIAVKGINQTRSTVDLARVTTAPDSHRALATMNVQKLSQDNAPDKLNRPNEPYEPFEPLESPPVNVAIGVDNQTISIESPYVMRTIAKVKKIAKQSNSKNWGRQAKPQGPKENTLTIETFGLVNVQTCKKLVDTNEVVCYAADEHYISDDDSGAPAVRQGHLVAVTLGGVECDGDHVAIGMKMNCFCSWIAENLPEKNVDWKCCKDCCSGDEPKKPRRLRNKN